MNNQTNATVCRAPKLLAIMPTQKCTASCAECGSASSPGAQHRLPKPVVLQAVCEAADLGFAAVAFTGGEATLEWTTLLEGLHLAASFDLKPRLVSNGHWAHTPNTAVKRLRVLIENGLDNLNLSTGDEHAQYVPVERVVNATVAALDLGINVHITVEYRAERTITKDFLHSQLALKTLAADATDRLRISESPWMPIDPLTRAAVNDGDTVDGDNVTLREGCPSVLQSYSVEPDGRVAACCGLGIGDSDELHVGVASGVGFLRRAIELAESDLLKLWLRAEGPEQILSWAASRNPAINWENMYAHNCQACRRLYTDSEVASVIRDHHEEVIASVFQTLWLNEEYYPSRLRDVC
jgi:hypothetical protein